MDIKQTMLELCRADGVSGAEAKAVEAAAAMLGEIGEVTVTGAGCLICRVQEPMPGGPLYMLDAHIDEIGMIVKYITEEGFLRVSACGGLDRRLLAASPVTVHTASGPVKGVVCSTPPHIQGGEEKKNPKVDELYIDVGLPDGKARARIACGDLVTIDARTREMPNDTVCSKALDDRAGCAAVMKAAELLKNRRLRCGLVLVLSTQEEVGALGAATAAFGVHPTHAITVDVSFAHTPDAVREDCGELKKGPMLGIAPLLDREMFEGFKRVAAREHIPYQVEVMGRSTGTNADEIAKAGPGVRTALVSIPLKYMHTPVERIALCDVENTAKLIAAYIAEMEGVTNA